MTLLLPHSLFYSTRSAIPFRGMRAEIAVTLLACNGPMVLKQNQLPVSTWFCLMALRDGMDSTEGAAEEV